MKLDIAIKFCRSPYGERGLKLPRRACPGLRCGRSPYGERGLKLVEDGAGVLASVSLSLRRAWIEIAPPRATSGRTCRSPYGERGLKYIRELHGLLVAQVALLTESVD